MNTLACSKSTCNVGLQFESDGSLTECRDAKRACHARIRRQPSIRKRLSLDATLAMADMDLPVPTQDLISSAVSFSPALASRTETQCAMLCLFVCIIFDVFRAPPVVIAWHASAAYVITCKYCGFPGGYCYRSGCSWSKLHCATRDQAAVPGLPSPPAGALHGLSRYLATL